MSAGLASPGRSAPAVIVTRPAREAEAWVTQLQQAGFAAEALPLMGIVAADNPAAVAEAWRGLHAFSACLFVSGNAVEFFFRSKPAMPLPPQTRFLAPGPGTAAALVALGVAPSQIDMPAADASQFDSEALWRVIGLRDWQGQRVLVVRGDSDGAGTGTAKPGRDWISNQWQVAGAQVDFLSVYQRRAPQLNAAQMERARRASVDGSVWLFSSSEAVAHLAAQADIEGIGWRQARAVATHPRIAETARAAGWGVVVESRPSLRDIGQALRSIESL
ncbi:uroporphyrinogen-III synthase [Polaromonas sp. YR568]|uniref:uroporphyrinogen-III synthase n=1 Tax=Polaromonas sp. YR568 TaxID=1855301 RepID=UPI0031377E61